MCWLHAQALEEIKRLSLVTTDREALWTPKHGRWHVRDVLSRFDTEGEDAVTTTARRAVEVYDSKQDRSDAAWRAHTQGWWVLYVIDVRTRFPDGCTGLADALIAEHGTDAVGHHLDQVDEGRASTTMLRDVMPYDQAYVATLISEHIHDQTIRAL